MVNIYIFMSFITAIWVLCSSLVFCEDMDEEFILLGDLQKNSMTIHLCIWEIVDNLNITSFNVLCDGIKKPFR